MALRYAHITAAGNLSVAPANGPAELWSVNVNTAAASAVFTVYDGTDNTGTVVAVIDASSKGGFWFAVLCPKGIFCVLSGGNADVTVGFR